LEKNQTRIPLFDARLATSLFRHLRKNKRNPEVTWRHLFTKTRGPPFCRALHNGAGEAKQVSRFTGSERPGSSIRGPVICRNPQEFREVSALRAKRPFLTDFLKIGRLGPFLASLSTPGAIVIADQNQMGWFGSSIHRSCVNNVFFDASKEVVWLGFFARISKRFLRRRLSDRAGY